MAQLASYKTNGYGEKHKFTVDRNCSRLILKRVSTASITDSLVGVATERLTANIRTHSNNIEEVIRLQALLSHVAAFSAMIHAEPIFELRVNANDLPLLQARGIDTTGVDFNLGDNWYITYFHIDLTAQESAPTAYGVGVTSDDDFSLLVEDMLAAATYVLYGVEEPVTGSNMLEYMSVNNIGGQKLRRIDVDHLDALVLPCISAIQKLKLHYPMGEPVEYSLEELKLLNAQAVKDEVYLYAGIGVAPTVVTPLVSDLLVLLTHNVVSVDLYTDGTQFEFTQVRNRARGAA